MFDIIVYGRGKTGIGLYQLAKTLGYNPIFYDDSFGFDGDAQFTKDSLIVTSPGVKPTAKGILAAKDVGAKMVGELEFCFPLCKGRCVSVTGTNGKTTTCQLIHHILKLSAIKTHLLGNGGVPFSTEVLKIGSDDITVLESSSFQLDNANNFSPSISVVTNIAADHLDYHGNFESYITAKCNNFRHQDPHSFAVFNADDRVALEISADSPAYTLYYSTYNPYANCFYSGDVLQLNVAGESVNYRCEFLKTLPRHNLSNALCAVLVCYLLGVNVEQSCECLTSYQFLPHRLQTVADFNGVKFVDDSKATNVHATISALNCYENTPLALILGGSDKGCEFDDIFLNVKSNVKMICAVGQTANKIYLTGRKYFVEVKLCDSYRQAVDMCYRKLKNVGGVVLMSNACASFDEFGGYDERGNYFTGLVEELCRDEKEV